MTMHSSVLATSCEMYERLCTSSPCNKDVSAASLTSCSSS